MTAVKPLREVAVSWVARKIREHFPWEQQPEQLAENLVAIAEFYRVPDETLVRFVETRIRITTADWRIVCEEYADALRANEAAPC